ncbi:ABC transporter-like protein [Salinarchaeum sp. Harcht-Bsk1]|uniref:ABC transporter ATP-binding protein n=1 Tax=Salinarchaeum sp. Harcht-Bsk1 TaxID=1333523 RepID=UPI0003422BBA|nr:ABC transporter ATP-binding protein [Salinarchaeum sp. Harcht-Bsk1]AGN01287.1 ABC transporter-like protein [Salinarchaeum sp. Harcht-Bsk1]
MTAIELDDVHTYYGQSHILQGVSLSVEDGENVALLGRNGVGKTTTLRSILQLTPPRSGTVRVHDEDVTGLPTHEVARRGVGWVPEERRMFSHLTVAENVRASIPPEADPAERMRRAFDRFPDLEELREHEAGSLSGGQQQMLAIARALVGDNDVLLVDEPSEGLAPLIVEEVVEALEDLPDDQTLVLVEQNVPMALALTDRFYVLDHGEVVAEGDSADASLEDDRIRRYLTA